MGERVRQCVMCGVERDAENLPGECPICADERQYVNPKGQRWTDPRLFRGRIELREYEPDLWAIEVEGAVGIGQFAKVIVTAGGTVMFDVPGAINEEAVEAVRTLGPLRAIIPSHPHMFGVQSLWSTALRDAPVFVSRADADWLGVRPDALELWEDSFEPVPGVVVSQPGGHFPGSSVVQWHGLDRAGVLLSSDTIMVNPDQQTVSFMRSYPNRIPLSAPVVERIAEHVDRYEFDRVYSNAALRIRRGGKEAVRESARRQAAWARGDFDDLT